MPFLKIQGMKIHYQWVGKKSGRQLVFLHGWAANSKWWFRQIPVLSKEYKLILVDLPGHGFSEDLPTYSEKALSSVVDNTLNRLGVETPVVVGWSLGGMVALQYALDYPTNLSALILVDTSPTMRMMPSYGFIPTIPYYQMPDPRSFLVAFVLA